MLAIVHHCMLPRQGKARWSGVPHTSVLEDLPVLMKLSKSFIKPIQCQPCEHTQPHNVAEVKICIEAPDHHLGYKTLDR